MLTMQKFYCVQEILCQVKSFRTSAYKGVWSYYVTVTYCSMCTDKICCLEFTS